MILIKIFIIIVNVIILHTPMKREVVNITVSTSVIMIFILTIIIIAKVIISPITPTV